MPKFISQEIYYWNGKSAKNIEIEIFNNDIPLLTPLAAWSFNGTDLDAVGNREMNAIDIDERWGAGGVRPGTQATKLVASSNPNLGGYYSYGNSNLIFNNGFTLSIWVKDDEFDGEKNMVFLNLASNDNNVTKIRNVSDPATEFWLRGEPVFYGNPVGFNVWTNYVVTDDGTAFKAYRNGVLVESSPSSIVFPLSGIEITLGSDPDGPYAYYFTVADLLIYDFAVSPTQVGTLYNGGAGYFPL